MQAMLEQSLKDVPITNVDEINELLRRYGVKFGIYKNKDVAEAGRYGVVFGSDLSAEKLEEFKQTIIREPRRFIAQEVIDFKDLPIIESGETVMRKADLRAFVLSGETTRVWASGLTRFSRNHDSFVVNSSQGGGFKDTWVQSR